MGSVVLVRKHCLRFASPITLGECPCLVRFPHYSHASLLSRIKYELCDCNDRHVTVMIEEVQDVLLIGSSIQQFSSVQRVKGRRPNWPLCPQIKTKIKKSNKLNQIKLITAASGSGHFSFPIKQNILLFPKFIKSVFKAVN
jgi:hypothetical protein